MKTFFQYARLAAVPLVLMFPLAAQQEPGITRQQADEILNELRQIRQLLEKQGGKAQAAPDQPVRAKVNLEGTAMLGSKDAPFTMVEFTDYQCPFCQRFHATVYPELKKNYIDTGKLRFYSRDMPLDFHANAMRAAMAARCARDQGKFWELREVMSSHPDKLDMDNLMANAGSLKMDVNTFKTCVTSEKYKDAVQSDVLEAMRIGANGTPSFVLGKSTPEGVDGELVVGALPFVVFDGKLKDLEAGK
jgi:protein-disulfide isomerase